MLRPVESDWIGSEKGRGFYTQQKRSKIHAEFCKATEPTLFPRAKRPAYTGEIMTTDKV
jgi:hypothetical protein